MKNVIKNNTHAPEKEHKSLKYGTHNAEHEKHEKHAEHKKYSSHEESKHDKGGCGCGSKKDWQ